MVIKDSSTEDKIESIEDDGEYFWETPEVDRELDFSDMIDVLDFGEDGEYELVDKVDSNVQSQDQKSDDSYQKTAREIVKISKDQLNKQYRSKRSMQNILLNFFVSLLLSQFFFIIVTVMLKGLNENFVLSDQIILVLITSVFVETLGVIAIMVRFAFNSNQEIEIISILHSYIKDFKIYKSSEHDIPKNNKDEDN